MSDAIVDREEIELMLWAVADIRTDLELIKDYLLGGDDEEEAWEGDS